MKKWFLFILILCLFLLTGCTTKLSNITFKDTANFTNLNEVTSPNQEYVSYTEMLEESELIKYDYINDFASKMAKELFVGEENYIFSPISLYMALGMLTEGSDGTSKEQLLSLLGNDLEKVSSDMQNIYDHNYYSNNDGKLRFANSLWFEKGFEPKEDYLKIIASKYYANAYETKFDDEGKENIIDWINFYTEDLLKLTKANYPIESETKILLLNTVYFDNKWKEEFKEDDSYKAAFNNNENNKVEYMNHTIMTTYYENDEYVEAYDYFKNDNKIRYILPNEGINVLDLIEAGVINNLNLDKLQEVDCSITVPKFKISSSYVLNESISNLGVDSIFSDQANFSKMSDRELLVSLIKQDAVIELSEKGVKAAAVTSISMDEAVMVSMNLNLNRTFIYVIYDEMNVPLFMGIVSNPNQ